MRFVFMIFWIILSYYILSQAYRLWILRDVSVSALSYSAEVTMQYMYMAAIPWAICGILMKVFQYKAQRKKNKSNALSDEQTQIIAAALAANKRD